MAIPTIQAVGTPNNGTGAVTYTLPAHQANDILLLFVECAESAGVTAPSGGWAHITNSPRAQGSNVTAVNVMWLRAAGSGTTNPQVADPGNHQVGVAVVVRGAITSGDPWDFAPVGDGAAGATSFSADPGTTTVADCLVFLGIAGNTDTTSDQWTSVANATLSSFGEREQFFTDDGNGGGIGVYSGGKATTGSTGNTTGNMATQTWSGLTFAIKPSTGSQDEVGTGTLTGSGTLTASGAPGHTGSAATSGSGTLTASGIPGPTGTATLSGSGSLATGATTVVTNLVPNPSFEVNEGGLGTINSAAVPVTSTALGVVSGSNSAKTTAAGPGVNNTSGFTYGTISIPPSAVPFTFSAYLSTPDAGIQGRVRIIFWGSGNTVQLNTVNASYVSVGSSPTRISVTGTPSSTPSHAEVWMQFGNGGGPDFAGTETFYIDALLLTVGSTLHPYFDGSTTDAGSDVYDWTGTAHNSTSTWTSGVANIPGFNPTVALSGSGTLAGTQTAVTVSGSASLSGSGTLAGAQTVVTASGTAATSGSGTLTASGAPGHTGSASLSGSGTLTASGIPSEEHAGSASLSGSGSLSTGLITLVATNLVANPSFETNLTGWELSVGSITRPTGLASAGTHALKLTVDDGIDGAYVTYVTDEITEDSPFCATVDVLDLVVAGDGAVSVVVSIYDGDSFVESQYDITLDSSDTFPVTVTSPTLTTGTNGPYLAEIVFSVDDADDDDYAILDAVLFADSAAPVDYFDGDTTDDSVNLYDWTGTAHASTSTWKVISGNLPAITGATAALSGSGTLTASGAPATSGTAALSGSGTLTASGDVIESHTGSASLSGSGTLTAAGFGFKNIAYSASGSTTAVNSTSTMTINITSAAVGSMVYAWGSWGGDFTSVTSPGWTFLVDDEIAAGGGGAPNHYFLARRLKLTGDTTFVFTGNGDTGKGSLGWSAYSNVDTTTPEEQLTARESATTNQATIPTNSATPTAANRWALAAYAMRNATDSTNTFTPGSGLTERVDVTNGSGAAPWMSIEIADSAGVVTAASHSYTADNTLLTSQSASVLLYLRPAPIVVEFTGSASLSGSGTLTASGAPAFSRAVALSGSGSLSAAGVPAPVAAVPLSGSGSLSTTQTAVTASGTAALSGTGTLAASGLPRTTGSATLSGSGTLAASGSLGFNAAATLSGSGTLAASGIPRPVAAVSLAGTGTLVAAATPAVTQQVTLSGTGSLTAAVSVATSGSATLSGSGTLTATGTPHPLAGGIAATITNLVPNPSAENNRVGWNSSGGSFTRDNAVAFSGSWSFRLQSTGTFGSTVEMHSESDARLPVTAGLTYAVSASATGPVTGDGSYSMSVSWYDNSSTLLETTSPVTIASLTNTRADLVQTPTAPVGATELRINLSGVSATNAAIWFDSIQVTEGATLYPYFDGSVPDDATYTYSWTGTAHNSTSTRVLTAGSVPFTGSGTLTPTGVQAITGATAALTGTGVLEVTGTDMTVTSFVPLTGTGTLQAFAVDVHQAALSGLGTLLATGTALFEIHDITVTGRLIRGHSGYLISAPSNGRLLAPASSGTLREPGTGGGVFRTEDGVLLL